jgi:hypothetical protein
VRCIATADSAGGGGAWVVVAAACVVVGEGTVTVVGTGVATVVGTCALGLDGVGPVGVDGVVGEDPWVFLGRCHQAMGGLVAAGRWPSTRALAQW